MDAVKFIEERKRMCKSFGTKCKGCPAFNDDENEMNCEVSVTSTLDATTQIAMVKKWSAEHPLKTRQDVFLEQYPDAQLTGDGVISICPMCVSADYRDENGCCTAVDNECIVCCREFWMQEAE